MNQRQREHQRYFNLYWIARRIDRKRLPAAAALLLWRRRLRWTSSIALEKAQEAEFVAETES